ncbi:hypothetical protein EMIT043CA1_180080 [Pseudomonas brassicacearum]
MTETFRNDPFVMFQPDARRALAQPVEMYSQRTVFLLTALDKLFFCLDSSLFRRALCFE